MKCLSRFCMLFATFAICCCLCITCFAEESSDSSDDITDDISAADDGEDMGDEVAVDASEDDDPIQVYEVVDAPSYDADNPLPVVIVDDEQAYSVSPYSSDTPVLVIGNTPPDELLFSGAGWITGTDSKLGKVTLYFPISYKSGYWGTDSNGYLFNVSSSSLSGYLSSVYNNSVTASAFSYPRYRLNSSSSTYEYLYLIPEDSNMEIAVSDAPKYTIDDFTPYLILLVGGVLFLCFMKR